MQATQGKDIDLKIPKCLDMITHKHVIEAIESYYEGGVVQYGEGWNGVQSKLNKDKPSENKPICQIFNLTTPQGHDMILS